MNNTGPCYLRDLLCMNRRKAGLRSGNKSNELIIPYVKNKTFVNRSFSVAGPKLWNKLPNFVRNCANMDEFKKSLKTYLFDIYFSESDWLWY